MTSSKSYGIGILGLGIMGREMAERLHNHPRFRLVSGYDPAPPATSLHLAQSPEEVAANPRVDCVYIAAPPAFHASSVALAVRHGKAVLCEKPLAPSVVEAEAMRDLVAAAGKPAAVNFSFAAGEAATRMRHLVSSGALGEIREAKLTLRFKAWPRGWQSGAGPWLSSADQGGFTREVCSHFLFQAGRLFGAGRCVEKQVQRGPQGTETSLKARIDYSGLSLRIDGAVTGEIDDSNRFELIGSKGSVALVDWQNLDYRGGAPLPEVPPMPDQLAEMLDGKPHQLATFAEGAAVTALTETLLA